MLLNEDWIKSLIESSNFQPELLLASKTSELNKNNFTDYLKMKVRKDTKTIYTLWN